MKAWVHVFNHPKFFVTSEDGSYEITGLPPGKYTIAAWIEYADKPQEITVELTKKGEEKKDFTFK